MTVFVRTSNELLHTYTDRLRLAFRAEQASLFLPFADEPAHKLVHRGTGEPVPEMRDESAATVLSHQVKERALTPSSALKSVCPRSALIVIPSTPVNADFDSGDEKRRREADNGDAPPAGILGLRYESPSSRDEAFGEGSDAGYVAMESSLQVTALAGELLRQSMLVSTALEDPVSGLPGRALFQVQLRRNVEAARAQGRATALLLVSPDGFGGVNEQLGRETGDRIIAEIATRLKAVLRSDDIIAKYGGAIFTLLITPSSARSLTTVGNKLRNTLGALPFLDGSVPLDFSVGAATLEPSPRAGIEPAMLLQRADQALGVARQAGGSRFELWSEELETTNVLRADPLNGIFTGNMSKDYRNMALLSQTMNAVASARDVQELLVRVVRPLAEVAKADCVAVCTRDDDGGVVVTHGVSRENGEPGQVCFAETTDLAHEASTLVAEAMHSGRVVDAGVVEGTLAGGAQMHSYAVPLTAREESLACLYLDGRADRLAVDAADAGFLQALASQLAVAFDRSRLAEQQFAWQEAESQRLRGQLDELREAVQQTKLIYRSDAMKRLLETASRVAATDATVLVTGESGTGKELVARAVHRLSPRRHKAPIIVDCASVPSTLIESELFGHERGAYTGAERRKIGRLVEADGGTVILDEIGELPLEIQSKLLRFVQEKEVVPVGGSRVRKVDARVVAATNRELADEVENGRFRADLYYRLNVVHLRVPRLSERPDDILYLAHHFLQKFSVQYQKGILRRLSAEAEHVLQAHSWPGNVRELQNRVMQAVILSTGVEIGVETLGIVPEKGGPSPSAPHKAADPRAPVAIAAPPSRDSALSSAKNGDTVARDTASWQVLRDALSEAVETALEASSPPALGTWLVNELVIEANDGAGDVMRRAADRIGMPEATFRRRLKKARENRDLGGPPPPHWERIRSVLASLLSMDSSSGEDLVKRARTMLLEDVRRRLPRDVAVGSALMGVTEPTFRRWTRDLS